jgi:hypothetical protein
LASEEKEKVNSLGPFSRKSLGQREGGLVDKTIIQSQEEDDCLAPIQIEMSGIII